MILPSQKYHCQKSDGGTIALPNANFCHFYEVKVDWGKEDSGHIWFKEKK